MCAILCGKVKRFVVTFGRRTVIGTEVGLAFGDGRGVLKVGKEGRGV
jgi:hypothetical protein